MIKQEEANAIARNILNDETLTVGKQLELLKELENFVD